MLVPLKQGCNVSIDTLDLDDDLSISLFNFAQGVSSRWNGREITLQDAFELKEEIQEHIFQLLCSKEPGSPYFDEMVAKLAWIGAEPQNRVLLEKEIVQLLSQSDGLYVRTREGFVMSAGLGKKIGKCWKKHKTAIIIGAVVTAIVVTAVVVTVCSGGTAGGVAAVAGSAAASTLQNSSEGDGGKERSSSTHPSSQSAPLPSIDLPSKPFLASKEVDLSPPPAPPVRPIFLENGIIFNNRYLTYWEICQYPHQEELFSSILKPSPSPVISPQTFTSQPADRPIFHEDSISWNGRELTYGQWLQRAREEELLALLSRTSETQVPPATLSSPSPLPSIPEHQSVYEILERIGRDTIDLEPQDPNASLIQEGKRSRRFETPGTKKPHCAIGGINGINNTFDDSNSHAAYLSKLADKQSISWVHNQSHGALVDLAEVFTANYLGFSPNTGKLLTEAWQEFHEQNRDHPHAKFLQFCHSQGAIHVRNALAHAPKEIRARVIVVAIAPAVVVSRELCYNSYNYASKKDIVHYGELAFLGALDSNETGTSAGMKCAMKEREELICLEPHPEATGIDHEFQSPTYRPYIERHIEIHKKNGGKYL